MDSRIYIFSEGNDVLPHMGNKKGGPVIFIHCFYTGVAVCIESLFPFLTDPT
jgi:hypothetical protein